MRKRRILLLLFPVAAVVIVGLWIVLTRQREPEYEGKKLSECVIELVKPTGDAETTAAKEAIRQMGTNALPYLIEWVGYETPTWKRKVSWTARILRVSRWQFIDQMQVYRRVGAMYAFKQLGAKAEREIGSLSRIANDPKRSQSRTCAIWVLGEIGAAALPGIVGVLTNEQSRTAKSSEIRMGCATIICRRAIEEPTTARLAEPALLSMREDPDPNVRLHATNALRELDPKRIEMLRKAGNY